MSPREDDSGQCANECVEGEKIPQGVGKEKKKNTKLKIKKQRIRCTNSGNKIRKTEREK